MKLTTTCILAAVSILPLQSHDSDLPLWHGQFRFAGFLTYDFDMVGTDPSLPGNHTTTIRTVLFPVQLRFIGGITTNASKPMRNSTGIMESPLNLVVASPLFQSMNYFVGGLPVGNTQYIDAYNRANFFNHLNAGHDFRVVLQNPPVVVPVTIDVPFSAGFATLDENGTHGFVDEDFLKAQLHSWMTLAGTAALPIFLLADTKMTKHNGSTMAAVHGFTGKQTYIIADFSPRIDVSPLSHEIGEWLADPYLENATPGWPAPDGGCSKRMEIADPINALNQSVFIETKLGWATFHLQDFAFLSWFAHRIPSTSAAGFYTFWGNDSGPAALCMH